MTDIRIALKAQGMVPGASPCPPLPAETTCPPAARRRYAPTDSTQTTAAQRHTVAGQTQSPPASSQHPEPEPYARSPTPHELPSHPLAPSTQARTSHVLPNKRIVCLHAKYSAVDGPRRGCVCMLWGWLRVGCAILARSRRKCCFRCLSKTSHWLAGLARSGFQGRFDRTGR